MDDSEPIIPARSRRQVMDWALALASQGIGATVVRTDRGWGLAVESADHAAAMGVISQYEIENRGWRWKRRLAGPDFVFHAGSLVWAAALVGIYYWCETRFPGLKDAGVLDSEAARHGQWWRLWTAMTLHADLEHLTANLVIGALLLGLAMARFGAGVALLASALAGVAGNVAGLFVYAGAHDSLGASGMVTGALGLLAASSLSGDAEERTAPALAIRGASAAALLLVLIGFSPGADWVAHVGGFVAGGIIGVGLGLAPMKRLQHPVVNLGAVAAVIGLTLAAWRLAAG